MFFNFILEIVRRKLDHAFSISNRLVNSMNYKLENWTSDKPINNQKDM